MDEHAALLDEAHHVRRAFGAGDQPTAMARLGVLVSHLSRHVRREEAGVFAALRAKGEFVEEIEQLEREHRDFDAECAALHADTPDLEERVERLLHDLGEHVEREDLGIFPVSVVTLGAAGWEVVEQARVDAPSFLVQPGDDLTSV